MNAAAINNAQNPEFSEEENKLAEKSVQRARTDIQWNAFWFEITCCYFWWLMPTFGNWFLGLMFLTLGAAFGRWHTITQNKFQRVAIPQKGWPQIIKGQPFGGKYDIVNLILALSFLITCLQQSRNLVDTAMYVALICFSFFFAFKYWRFLANHRTWIVLNVDKLITKEQYTIKGKKSEEYTSEIPFSEIYRVESHGFRNLHIYKYEDARPIAIEAQTYGNKGLAAILAAIEKHAPQAQFDTEADLMRRSYFSW